MSVPLDEPTNGALPAPAPDDPLRLAICPTCGYSLEGLPDEGICPECGGGYDQSAVILQGSDRGVLAQLVNAGYVPALGLMATAAIQFAYFGGGFGALRSRFVEAVFATYLAAGAVLLVGRLSHTGPGAVRVRLDPEGCSQRDTGSGPSVWATLLHWWQFSFNPLLTLLYFGWFVQEISPGMRLWFIGAIALAVVLLAGLWWWTRARTEKARLAAELLHGRCRESQARWASVSQVHLTPLTGDRLHLRLWGRGIWRTPSNSFVDAKVNCTPVQAEALRRRIAGWRKAQGWTRGRVGR